MNKLQLAVATLATLAAAQIAQATLTVTSTVGGGAPAGSTKYTFDTLPLGTAGGTIGGVNVTFTGNGTGGIAAQGSLSGVYAAPYFSGANDVGFGNAAAGADATTFLTTGTVGGSVTLTFSGPQTYLGLVWGSVDNYNKLELYDGATKVGEVVPGVTPGIAAAAGNQAAAGTYWVDIVSTAAFNKVVATSGQYAFEIDNVAVAVPEPSTYVAGALLLLPFGASAVRALRRNRGQQ